MAGGLSYRFGHTDHAKTGVELVIIAGHVRVYDSPFIISSLVILR
jgi:hypothetical protein